MDEVIAIDGPAGAGKSTLARKLSQKLGCRYLDTGAMYRAVTLVALKNNLNLSNHKDLGKLARSINISFLPPGNDEISHILVNDEDVTDKIRKTNINRKVSRVAKIKDVRDAMVKQQRLIAESGNIIMDGRDIGSRVLPNADIKLFITASLEERAKRRYQDIKKNNSKITFNQLKKEIKKRDKNDSERENSPLVKTEDAILIDTTNLSIKMALNKIIQIIQKGG